MRSPMLCCTRTCHTGIEHRPAREPFYSSLSRPATMMTFFLRHTLCRSSSKLQVIGNMPFSHLKFGASHQLLPVPFLLNRMCSLVKSSLDQMPTSQLKHIATLELCDRSCAATSLLTCVADAVFPSNTLAFNWIAHWMQG